MHWKQTTQHQNIEKIQTRLSVLHKELHPVSANHRDKARARARKGVLPNYHVGDFVLVGQLANTKMSKLQVKWQGPMRVLSIPTQWICVVENLITGKQREVHCSRLKFYHDPSLGVTSELLDFAFESTSCYEAAGFQQLRYNANDARWELLTLWRGFNASEATWEPLTQLHEDVPELTRAFLTSLGSDPDASAARQTLA